MQFLEAREKILCLKFFSDPLMRCWDCGLKHVHEYESCHNCFVNSAIVLLVMMILIWTTRLVGEKNLCQSSSDPLLLWILG
jgi:hypothetical protein